MRCGMIRQDVRRLEAEASEEEGGEEVTWFVPDDPRKHHQPVAAVVALGGAIAAAIGSLVCWSDWPTWETLVIPTLTIGMGFATFALGVVWYRSRG